MTAVSFGYKATWLVVQDRSAEAVADALRLPKRRPISWKEGVDAAYRGEILITAPIDGWTFVLTQPGPRLLDPSDDRFPEWFAGFSADVGTVRSFVTHRVIEMHGWARATEGEVERVYNYCGESGEATVDLGEPTAEERELGMGDADWEPDEEDVLKLSGLWCVNPGELDGREAGDCVIASKTRWRPMAAPLG